MQWEPDGLSNRSSSQPKMLPRVIVLKGLLAGCREDRGMTTEANKDNSRNSW